MQPNAKIICDSISEQGHRLVTMEVVMHRFILAEMNTHRAFSRNSASSRAIPYQKIRNRIMESPAYPVHWGSEQKGMASGDELQEAYLVGSKRQWDYAMDDAITHADIIHEFGLHKSLLNRLLEPFMWHTAIISATEWDNFFWQRCDPAAQPEMKRVADAMQIAYFSSTPKLLGHGEWHLPYISQEDWDKINDLDSNDAPIELAKQTSVARCARVSYLTQDGKRDVQEDLSLYLRLKGSGHWSPFEHVATPVVTSASPYDHGMTGNFVGWRQFRKTFLGENRAKFIPNLPELAQVKMRMEAGLPR